MTRILMADDDPGALRDSTAVLVSAGHAVTPRSSARELLAALATDDADVVLSAVTTRDLNGLELCQHVVANRPDVPVILTTADARVETAIAAIRAGAYDFLVKPLQPAALLTAVERAAQRRALLQQINLLHHGGRRVGFEGILAESRVMRDVLEVVSRVADSEASVLISGASGTGKELVARALHNHSRRSGRPFVSINCAALPEALLESELFGHARGAFTDAKQAHAGLFAQAQGGTLLLDEIGDMPIALQPKLLRALQERTMRPVGSTTEIPLDVRILASSNQDLEAAVEAKRFRSDLFFRVNVVNVALPPLRVRGNDILLLARHFLRGFALREAKAIRAIGPAAAEKLLAYDWPGNVRELQNCIERAVALGRYDELGPADLPERIREHSPVRLVLGPDDVAELLSLREIEHRYIARVLSVVDGNKTIAASVLGIDRKTLYRKLVAIGLESATTPPDSTGSV